MNKPVPTNQQILSDAFSTLVDALSPLMDDPPEGTAADPETVKGCSAAVYGLDLVGLFLGESYHPGGPALTRRLADALDLQPGQDILDVASGVGATAFLLARERGVSLTGVDLGTAQVDKAQSTPGGSASTNWSASR